MDFKEKGIERAKKYVLEVNTKEILNRTLPDSDVLISEACFDDYTSGYNQALKDSKAPEMLEMLMILVGDIKQGPVDFTKSEKIKMTRRLINEVTGLCENT